MKKENRSFKIRNASRASKIKRFWLGFVILVPFLLLWVGQTVRSTQVSYQIQKLQDEIKKESHRQIELEMQRDQFVSLESIENAAKKKLGLIVPAKENIVLITLTGKTR